MNQAGFTALPFGTEMLSASAVSVTTGVNLQQCGHCALTESNGKTHGFYASVTEVP